MYLSSENFRIILPKAILLSESWDVDKTQDKHLFYEKNFYSKFGQDCNATGDQFSNCFTFELFFSLLNCFRFELDKQIWFRFGLDKL